VRGALAAVAIAALLAGVAGCSHDDKASPVVVDKTPPEQVLKRDCADPKWREQNLGLWYSVCRQSATW
jgi:hypothetical protein